jgi:hypothetical protein
VASAAASATEMVLISHLRKSSNHAESNRQRHSGLTWLPSSGSSKVTCPGRISRAAFVHPGGQGRTVRSRTPPHLHNHEPNRCPLDEPERPPRPWPMQSSRSRWCHRRSDAICFQACRFSFKSAVIPCFAFIRTNYLEFGFKSGSNPISRESNDTKSQLGSKLVKIRENV